MALMVAYAMGGQLVHVAFAQLIHGQIDEQAQRIEPATTCTEVADVTDVHYRTVGLGKGQYACPKPVEYDWCANYPALSDSAFLARPGVAVAAGAAVAALL